MNRQVRVLGAASADEGFSSRFDLGFRHSAPMASLEFFLPAVWYKQKDYAGKNGDHRETFFYYRETRAALPMIEMRDPAHGFTVTLCHLDSAAPASSGALDKNGLLKEAYRQASLGAEKKVSSRIGVLYPSLEKLESSTGREQRSPDRSHPVQVGFEQRYSVLISLQKTHTYEAAMADSWRYFYKLAKPAVASMPL